MSPAHQPTSQAAAFPAPGQGALTCPHPARGGVQGPARPSWASTPALRPCKDCSGFSSVSLRLSPVPVTRVQPLSDWSGH